MKFKNFEPDYTNVVNVAKNIEVSRIPLYEHSIDDGHMETVLNKKFRDYQWGNFSEQIEYFRNKFEFFRLLGYDTASIEFSSCYIFPGSGALCSHKDPAITCREDFEKYPFDEIVENYFKTYSENLTALREAALPGMKVIGGVGNGILEVVEDIVGYMDLCYISVDDPELYADLFKTVGNILYEIWKRLLKEYGDIFCVARFGDDLGYRTGTLIPPNDIRKYIILIPQYAKIISEVHKYNKPFLLHSCGCIFDVMDDIINEAHIDSKHSNEDAIAKFPYWVETYGDRIGNFGGIDTDAVCRLNKEELKDYITEVVEKCKGHGGFAFGSGNSIPDYVPLDNYLNMNEIIRTLRGE